jgi:hypothetical protein
MNLAELSLGLYNWNPNTRIRNTTTCSAAYRPLRTHKKMHHQDDAARIKTLELDGGMAPVERLCL